MLGSSGEFTGLTKQEKHDFFKFYADYTAGRTKLYAGTGSLNFEDTVALSNEVNEMGYEGAMVIRYAIMHWIRKRFLYIMIRLQKR